VLSQVKPRMIYYQRIPASLAGPLWVAVTDKGLFGIEFDLPLDQFIQKLQQRAPQSVIQPDEAQTLEACRQLTEYLQGKRQLFDLSVDMSGIPPFQQEALKATLAIPYGQTATYAEIAEAIGHPRAARAVGRAEATNPIPLVIPCHRVVGSDGKLHGYGGPGGISLKAKLLELENKGVNHA
jgi:methylated-DNA-[protein]-cysteine S-methyltransferase